MGPLGLIWVFWKLIPTYIANTVLINLVPQDVAMGITELCFNILDHFTDGCFRTYSETFTQVPSCLRGFHFKCFLLITSLGSARFFLPVTI